MGVKDSASLDGLSEKNKKLEVGRAWRIEKARRPYIDLHFCIIVSISLLYTDYTSKRWSRQDKKKAMLIFKRIEWFCAEANNILPFD